MPITPTYPGVYIEEIPSGVRTITGVATSITAFIGRALDGPVNEPTTIFSFADYERLFGGLWVESTMSYAVRDFYLNGGSQALIVRLYNDDGSPPPSTASISLPTVSSPPGSLELEAAYYGSWGSKLKASVNHNTKDVDEPSPDTNLFNLIVFEDKEGGRREEFLNVSVDPDDQRYLPRVLEQSSQLVRVVKNSSDEWIMPNERPDDTLVEVSPPEEEDNPIPASGGDDGGALIPSDYLGSEKDKTGIYALEKADLFNLLCIPPPDRTGDTDISVYQIAMTYCVERRAVLIVDSPSAWGTPPEIAASKASSGLRLLGLTGVASRNAALYFPRVKESDILRDGQIDTFVPCGIIAGVMARTDTQRGVWKAPAGLDAAMNGIRGKRTLPMMKMVN